MFTNVFVSLIYNCSDVKKINYPCKAQRELTAVWWAVWYELIQNALPWQKLWKPWLNNAVLRVWERLSNEGQSSLRRMISRRLPTVWPIVHWEDPSSTRCQIRTGEAWSELIGNITKPSMSLGLLLWLAYTYYENEVCCIEWGVGCSYEFCNVSPSAQIPLTF